MNVAVAPALQPRKRAPDPVSGCSRANASAIQAPAPLAKKPRRSRARIECSDDEPLHGEYYASVHEQSIEPRREQPSEWPREPADEALPRQLGDSLLDLLVLPRNEGSTLPPELARFVANDGYLDHGRITQPVEARCIFAGCSGTASRLLELVHHMMTPAHILLWPNAPTAYRLNGHSKSPCTAKLPDIAVCPFAASNGQCTNLDWAAFRVVVEQCVARISAGEKLFTDGPKAKEAARNRKIKGHELTVQWNKLRLCIDRVVAMDFILHNLQRSTGLRCSCGFIFGSAVNAALHVSTGCTGERHSSLDFLASRPPLAKTQHLRILAQSFTPDDDSSGTPSKVTVDNNLEDDEVDVSDDEKFPSKSYNRHGTLCVWERDLEAQPILDAAPPGNLIFFLKRYSGPARRGQGKKRDSPLKEIFQSHGRAFDLHCPVLQIRQDDLSTAVHPIIPTMPEFTEYYNAFLKSCLDPKVFYAAGNTYNT